MPADNWGGGRTAKGNVFTSRITSSYSMNNKNITPSDETNTKDHICEHVYGKSPEYTKMSGFPGLEEEENGYELFFGSDETVLDSSGSCGINTSY